MTKMSSTLVAPGESVGFVTDPSYIGLPNPTENNRGLMREMDCYRDSNGMEDRAMEK